MDQSVNIDEWVIVKSLGGGYIGKPDIEFDRGPGTPAGAWQEAIITAVSQGDCLKLGVAFEFVPVRRQMQDPNGQIGFSLEPLVTPIDFTLNPLPLYVKAQCVYFCADMQKEDKELYKGFAEQVYAQLLRRRAAASGLVLAVDNTNPFKKGPPHA